MASKNIKSYVQSKNCGEAPEEHYYKICKEHEKGYDTLRCLFCVQVENQDTTCDENGLEKTRIYLKEIESILSGSYFRHYGFGDQCDYENFLRKACLYCIKHYPVSKEKLGSLINML